MNVECCTGFARPAVLTAQSNRRREIAYCGVAACPRKDVKFRLSKVNGSERREKLPKDLNRTPIFFFFFYEFSMSHLMF